MFTGLIIELEPPDGFSENRSFGG